MFCSLHRFGASILCCLPGLFALITLYLCYQSSMNDNRFPAWVFSPWISFTAVYPPGKQIFGIGLSLTGLAGLPMNKLVAHPIKSVLMADCPTLVHNSIINLILDYGLIISCICVSLTSWFSVSPVMVDDFLSPNITTMSWYPDMSTAIHILTASMYFSGTFYHAICVIILMHYSQHPLCASISFRISFVIKCVIDLMATISVFICLSSLAYVSFIMDGESMANMDSEHDTYPYPYLLINLIGFAQTLIVALSCLFWVTFILDYPIIIAYYQRQNRNTNKKKLK